MFFAATPHTCDINNKHTKTQTNQTKTKLSLQGLQWSRHSIAPKKKKNFNCGLRLANFFLFWFFGVAT